MALVESALAQRPAEPAAAEAAETSSEVARGGQTEEHEAVAEEPLGERAALEAFLDGVVLSQRREHDLAALTVSIVANDELWLAKGYGVTDLESERPVSAEQTLFRIGSVSKTFIWTAAMMLVERGQLDLDADVNRYLRDVRVQEAFGRPVTMRDLMSHRAGFEDTLRLFTVADDDGRSLAELLMAHQPRRVFAPGLRTSYSNWGSALAAQVVEDVAGVPYGDFLREEILGPLGMAGTTWLPPSAMAPADRERLATGYRRTRGALEVQPFLQLGAYWPAGGLASTATDMARWMRFHLNGGALEGVRLLTGETHALMWSRAYHDRPYAADVAHGFQDRPYRDVRTLAHAGGTAAFATNMVLVPELAMGFFVSQSSVHAFSPMAQLPERIIDRVRGYEYRPAAAAEGEARDLAELGGTYLNNRRVFSTFAALLGALNALTLTPVGGDAIVLTALGEARQYRRIGDAGDVFEGAGGERMAILRDERGNVAALVDDTGLHTFERVGLLDAPNTLVFAIGLAALLALTTLLGGRLGRSDETSFASRVTTAAGAVSAIAALWFFGSLLIMAVAFSDFDLAAMTEGYPTAAMLHVHVAGWAVAFAALAMVAVSWPLWAASGWALWQRVHYSVFALALIFLVFQLWQWRVIGAPVA